MKPRALLSVLATTVVVVALPGSGPGVAQESAEGLLQELRRAPDGQVRLRFEIDDGVVVCDDGSVSTGGSSFYWGRGREDRRCQEMEAQVRFSVLDGRVVEISRPEPGGRVPGGVDLGVASGPVAGDLFLRLARDRRRSSDLRKKAVFWLGQEAAAVNDDLADLAEDDSEDAEVRDAAVFALSQRPDDRGVPALMELVRRSSHPRVRKKAIFWLAQSRDPRVLPFFEEILLEGGGD